LAPQKEVPVAAPFVRSGFRQVLLASALQTLGVGTSSLQLQSFEAPMMQVVMKSDESQAPWMSRNWVVCWKKISHHLVG